MQCQVLKWLCSIVLLLTLNMWTVVNCKACMWEHDERLIEQTPLRYYTDPSFNLGRLFVKVVLKWPSREHFYGQWTTSANDSRQSRWYLVYDMPIDSLQTVENGSPAECFWWQGALGMKYWRREIAKYTLAIVNRNKVTIVIPGE